MTNLPNYIEINRKLWNDKVDYHLKSEFYGVDDFIQGASSLKSIELDLLGDIAGKSVLHLQCHFGQDTLSLARLGAKATGVDLSDKAIEAANKLNKELGLDAQFYCCDLYDLPNHLEQQFDIVYTSYGTIGWLPDLDKWAAIISRFLKPAGKFVFVEFHPFVWMFDYDFKTIAYEYFKADPIIETNSGTYADRDADITNTEISWNHSLSEVFMALINQGLSIQKFEEFNYSPYNCFNNTIEVETGKFMIQSMESKIPMVYSLVALK